VGRLRVGCTAAGFQRAEPPADEPTPRGEGLAPGGRVTAISRTQVGVTGCEMVNATTLVNPYSFDTGGFNCLRCDGSVQFIRQSVSAPALMAFITRAGGEVISVDN
jgi:hypothetical protein